MPEIDLLDPKDVAKPFPTFSMLFQHVVRYNFAVFCERNSRDFLSAKWSKKSDVAVYDEGPRGTTCSTRAPGFRELYVTTWQDPSVLACIHNKHL